MDQTTPGMRGKYDRSSTLLSSETSTYVSLIVFIAPTLVILTALLYRSALPYQINYNEGWNSFFVDRVLNGGPLYPGRDSMVANNYPPLSFYLIGGLSLVFPKIWYVGRAVSWIGFGAISALIFAIVRALGATRIGAAFGAALFCGLMATRYDLYVGMFDPQLTAHAVMLSAMLILARAPPRRTVSIAAAILVTIALFIKHSLIALPIAVTIWLARYNGRQALRTWFAAGILGASVATALCFAAYGKDFFLGLTAPREYLLSNLYQKMLHWIAPIQIPVILALLQPGAAGAGRARGLIVLYIVASLGEGALGAAGAHTNYNMIFDLLIAAAIGIGYLLGAPETPGRPRFDRRWVAAACAAGFLMSTAEVATSRTLHWRAWIAEQRGRAEEAQNQVEILRSRPGPALCVDLLLCYWAHKPFEFDPLNFEEAVKTGKRAPDGLIAAIANHYFSTIEISPTDQFLAKDTLSAIDRYYLPVPGHPTLFVPGQADQPATQPPTGP